MKLIVRLDRQETVARGIVKMGMGLKVNLLRLKFADQITKSTVKDEMVVDGVDLEDHLSISTVEKG